LPAHTKTLRQIQTVLLLPMLILLVLLTTPLATKAWERGKVETFATLPTGEAHPEGIAVGERRDRFPCKG
jgi:hypothetical protein